MRISFSTERSAIRFSTHLIRLSWGIVSKYDCKSASYTYFRFTCVAARIFALWGFAPAVARPRAHAATWQAGHSMMNSFQSTASRGYTDAPKSAKAEQRMEDRR